MARFLAGKKDNRLETSNLTTLSNSYDVYIVDIDDYNRIMNKNETLEQGEALIYMTQNSKFEGNTIEIEATVLLRLAAITAMIFPAMMKSRRIFLIPIAIKCRERQISMHSV